MIKPHAITDGSVEKFTVKLTYKIVLLVATWLPRHAHVLPAGNRPETPLCVVQPPALTVTSGPSV